MLLLDITVVNVALPDIQRSLHSSFQDLQWVVNAYSLTLAAFLLTVRALADLFGRRRVFAAGLVVFTLLLGALRPVHHAADAQPRPRRAGHRRGDDVRHLAGADRPGLPGRERGTAFGVFGAVTGAAVAVGPVIGGVITSGIGWEWIFFVNVPIGVGGGVHDAHQVAESRDPNATGVDWAGLVTFSGALFLLVFALVQGNDKGWGSTEIVAMLTGAVRAARRCSSSSSWLQARPMLDLSLFRRPAFAGANIVAFTLSALVLRDVPVPDALHPGRARLHARCRRACASCRPRCCPSCRADRGQAERARAGAPAARLGPGAGAERPAGDDGARRRPRAGRR